MNPLESYFLVLHGLSISSFSASILAYLDPGTGSYLIQLLVAGLLGGLFLVKMYWGKIIQFFRKLFKKEDPTETHNDPQ